MKTLYFFLIICSFSFTFVSGQEEDSLKNDTREIQVDSTYDFLLNSIENTDIGFLWSGDLSQNNRLGFIGENYQRLEIRYISVIQNFDNPYEYFLYGKTRVKNNICQFQGSLLITETGILEDDDFPDVTRAYLSGNYVIFEDQACLHGGIFRGSFITTIYLDEEGNVYYDDLEGEERDYTNNEFYGTWEGYYPWEEMDANWGDFRIPFSTQLDMGLESFKPSFNFLKNGWQEYLDEQEKVMEGAEVEMWWE